MIGIELADAYFYPAELLRGAVVSVGGQQVPGMPVLTSVAGGRLVLSVVVPAPEPGRVEVVVRYAGTDVRLTAAFTVTAVDVVLEPGVSAPPSLLTASLPPQGVLPLGPLPAD